MKKIRITKRTHYNPCFWTALWNQQYYEAVENQKHDSLRVRDQKVYTLNLYNNEVQQKKTDQVFFEKHLGVVNFNENDIEQFVNRNYPKDAEEKLMSIEKRELIIDFENHFTAFEKSPAYLNLISLVKDKRIKNLEEKGNIATFLILHNLRNHVIINSFVEFGKQVGSSKLEHFIHMIRILLDSEFMKNLIYRYSIGHWIIFTSKEPFPLIDSPICKNNGEIFCVLNPFQAISINLNNPTNQILYKTVDNINQSMQIKKILISNTYREIVFTNESQAEMWKKSNEWGKRRKLIQNKKTFSELIAKHNSEEIWEINAYANRL